MTLELSLARKKSVGGGRISHVTPEAGRLVQLGDDWLWACIQGIDRVIFFHPDIHTIRSSKGKPRFVVDGNLAMATVGDEEILRIGLKRGQSVNRNLTQAVLAY